MTDSLNVWVKTSTLDLAVHGSVKKHASRGLPGEGNDDDEFLDWGWAFANVLNMDDAILELTVRDEDSAHNGKNASVPSDEMKNGNVVMANKFGDNEDEYEEDDGSNYPDDLITLTHLHEPAVVHCLRQRYILDKIYTDTGPILLALNPFKNCKSLYTEKIMKEYWAVGERSLIAAVDEDDKLPPHVYAIADNSFRIMMKHMNDDAPSDSNRKGRGAQKTCDQSILVSGESGAGKTVTTKFIMQYLAKLSQRSHQADVEEEKQNGKTGGKTVEQQVLQSNPILESFGNARTIRNDNSSRFGKFIEIKFSGNGTLVGASIETYLLEKVRLISQSEGERNYHIFYELFCMDDSQLEEYHLENYSVEDFQITSMSGTFDRRDGVEDYETYDDLKKAMETMGMTDEEQKDVLAVPSAALHGSNVCFVAKSADESELDLENEHLQPFVDLLGITTENLDEALCYLKIKAGKEIHTRTLSKAKAEKGMEALIKAFYGALFTFLVNRINSSITVKDDGPSKRRRPGSSNAQATIGVLDIFGFESFKYNSFEQLCINYCNEALQQQFNLFVLKNEQEEYEREGIEWSFISFPENQDVLDLIDKKGTGILKILDDQCRAPGTTDKTFYQDLTKKCAGHSRFQADSLQIGAQKFGVHHYAGPVEYTTEGFVQKNRDDLPKEATDLLLSSKKELVKQLAAIISDPSGGSGPGGSSSSRKPTSRANSSAGSSGARITVGGQFSRQLQDLRHKIDLTSPHYIRCLKPNDILVPDHFDPLIISDQLRYAGVVEAVRVSRVGYPQRYTHATFIARYRILGLAEIKKAQRATKKKKPVNVLVSAVAPKVWAIQQQTEDSSDTSEEEKKGEDEALSLMTVGIQVGKTKVFLRRRAYDILEQLRSSHMSEAAVKMQAIARGYVDRRDYRTFRSSVIALQCCLRTKMAVHSAQVARENWRATIIQAYWRRRVKYQHYKAILFIASWIQKVQRGRLGRRRYEVLNQQRKSVIIQKYWRAYYLSKLLRSKKNASLTIQCAIRCMFAQIEFKKLRAGARDLSNALVERDELRKEVNALRKKLKEASSLAGSQAQRTALGTSGSEIKEARKDVENTSNEINQMKKLLSELQKVTKEDLERTQGATMTLDDVKQRAGAVQTEAKAMAQEINNVEVDLDNLKSLIKVKDEGIQILTAKLESDDAPRVSSAELDALQRELDEKAKELEDAKQDANDSKNREQKMEQENSELRTALESCEQTEIISYSSEPSGSMPSENDPSRKATSDELDAAKKEIEDLMTELMIARGQNLDADSSDEHELVKLELKEAKDKAAQDRKATKREIESLKRQLKNLGAATVDGATENVVHSGVASGSSSAAEEILILQDEVSRLNNELSDLKEHQGDPNSPEMLALRYEELRRLAEAGLEKDREIEKLKKVVENFSEERSQNSDFTSQSEVDHLVNEIQKLKRELIIYKNQEIEKGPTKSLPVNPKKIGFLGWGGKLVEVEDAKEENQIQHEMQTMKEVNELLRKDVVKSRKEINILKFQLREEAERSRQELEAFAETLKGVDELRRAAEAMSRELTERRRLEKEGKTESPTAIDEDHALEEATKILDAARADYDAHGQETTDTDTNSRPPAFWGGLIPNLAKERIREEEEMKNLPYAKHATAQKKKKKKKRRGSGNSMVSAFF